MPSLPREAYVRNGVWLTVPPLAISFGLWGALPEAYGAEQFDAGMPAWWRLTENVLRLVVFGLPAALVVGSRAELSRMAWPCYGLGLLAYLASYLMLVLWPEEAWSTSAVGFTAPAWTPAFWLVGLAMLCRASWLWARWRWWMYLVPVAAFLAVHVGHAGAVWSRADFG